MVKEDKRSSCQQAGSARQRRVWESRMKRMRRGSRRRKAKLKAEPGMIIGCIDWELV